MLDIAYGIPIAVNCLQGRNMLPERSFVLPNAVGWIANMVGSFPKTYTVSQLTSLGRHLLHLPHNRPLPLPPGSPSRPKQHE